MGFLSTNRLVGRDDAGDRLFDEVGVGVGVLLGDLADEIEAVEDAVYFGFSIVRNRASKVFVIVSWPASVKSRMTPSFRMFSRISQTVSG